ncbi:PTS fructose transporter subunit IA [Streptococcus gallolyticus]|uniref:PTS fructose transporter subunit IA n=1 Tax=Streptococcus gallolyticus TaxID=315405 RepID=A0A368UDJ9_9STRE|nr:DUF202 domain-containing protein [Streptococcus gallolyticus]RCW17014.1 PTS fructose transporter subunit IA [Streptococcus gallolyticus]
MTKSEVINGYQTEIAYQKHMIENLGRWRTLLFLVASIGFLLLYFFRQSNLILSILGYVLAFVGVLGMLLFGYGIYRGKQNVTKLIDDFELKLQSF